MDHDDDLLPLPTAARTRWRVQGSLLAAVLLLPAAVPLAAMGALFVHPALGVVAPVVAVVLAVTIGVTWANRRHRRFGYRLDHEVLRVRDGVVAHSDAVAPLYRVQHVDLTRGPLQLAFGLASLSVHTATPAADITLPDLRHTDAERVRDDILAASRRAAAELGVADVDAV